MIMKRMIFTVIALVVMMNVVSQDSQMYENSKGGFAHNVLLPEVDDVTLAMHNINFKSEVTNVTCYSANIVAQMTITAPGGYSLRAYGICYDTTAKPTTELPVAGIDADGNYMASLRGLKGNTLYYYRPYAFIDGTIYYGPTSSFKTLEDNVVVTGEVDKCGNVRSKLDIGSGTYGRLEFGVCWSLQDDVPTIFNNIFYAKEVDGDNYFIVHPHFYVGTYYYRSFVMIDGVTHYGNVKCTDVDMRNHEIITGEAVDLGLSVKWANLNVGAMNPESYGNYYSFGEIEPKETYSWGNYFNTNNEKKSSDNKINLAPEDDVAHVKWGGNWRIPTRAEQEELRKNCTWTWTNKNGVNGYIVIGPNGNSIFLPAAGFVNGSDLSDDGSFGEYWSSSLNTLETDNAFYLTFGPSSVYVRNIMCHNGLPVRPVCP